MGVVEYIIISRWSIGKLNVWLMFDRIVAEHNMSVMVVVLCHTATLLPSTRTFKSFSVRKRELLDGHMQPNDL